MCSTFEEHHGTIFNILWEMVVSSDPDLKANAAALLKALVSFSITKSSLGPDQYIDRDTDTLPVKP